MKNTHLGAEELSTILNKTTESIYKKSRRLNLSIYTENKDKHTKKNDNRLNIRTTKERSIAVKEFKEDLSELTYLLFCQDWKNIK